MPILSPHISKAHDYLSQAINYLQLAADQAHIERCNRHLLAIKESRINQLLDIVHWESRIRELLITTKCVREAQIVGLADWKQVSPIDQRGGASVDDQPIGGDVVAGRGSGDSATAGDPWAEVVPAGVQLGIPGLPGAVGDPSPGVEA